MEEREKIKNHKRQNQNEKNIDEKDKNKEGKRNRDNYGFEKPGNNKNN